MATTRTFLINASTRHAIFLNRFAGSQLKEILPLLERARDTVIKKLKKTDLAKLSKKRRDTFLMQLDADLANIYTRIGTKLEKNMKDFAEYEAGFSARMLTQATVAEFKVPAKAAIEGAVLANPVLLTDEALSIESSLRQFSVAKRKEMITTIKNGVIAGKTSEEIGKDIEFVAKKIQRNHASALVRTVVNHVSTAARQSVVAANTDIVSGEEWVSTLDGSTTSTCQALDGKVFKEGQGPRPPLHWGCRSTMIPVVKKKYRVVDKASKERPAIGSEGVENVKGGATYNSWLKTQPAEFQAEVLGVEKAKLFRDGGLSVRQFVDKKFQPLTLDELKRKEPLAFKKAGLTDK